MAATTGSLFDTHRERIEERLGKTIELFLKKADPVWRESLVSSQGVVPVGSFSRDFYIHQEYQNAVGGVFESGGPRNDFGLYGDNQDVKYGSKMYLSGVSQTWPDAKEDPSGMVYRLTIPMRTLMTNMRTTLAELRAEATPAFIGKIIAPRLLAFSNGLARRLCMTWYTSQAENYRLSTLGASTGSGAYVVRDETGADVAGVAATDANRARTITFYPPNYAISRFAVGERVDLFKDVSGVPTRINDTQTTASNQTLTTRIKLFVERVNKMHNEVVIRIDPDVADTVFDVSGVFTPAVIGESAYLVPANSTVGGNAFKEIAGLNSYLKFGTGGNDNKLLGAEAVGTTNNGVIDVTIHEQFLSFLKAVNGVLTEHKLNLYLDRVSEAMEDEGHFIDTLVTTQAVVRAMYAQKEGRYILDRTGQLATLTKEGEDGQGVIHHHNGRRYLIWTSRWQEAGVLHGYRRTNNWVRAIPPRLPKSGSMSEAEPFIPLELVVPALTGHSSPMFPILNNGNLTEMTQMPGQLAMQIYPAKQARGMKLTGLTEDRVLSDES